MTKKIASLLHRNDLTDTSPVQAEGVRYNVHTGLELELEQVHDAHEWGRGGSKYSSLIRVEGDGSLREAGAEFVYAAPLGAEQATAAIAHLAQHTKGYNPSERCSVHLHVNVLDITSPDLFRYILLYAIFEELLYARFGQERYCSNFCVPAGANEGLIAFLGNLDRGRVVSEIRRVQREDRRYGGINLASLERFGTVEFRFSRATSDAAEMLLLTNSLLAMREYAVRNKNVSAYIREASDRDGLTLFYDVFPEDIARALSTGIDIYAACLNGARVAERILHHKELSEVSRTLAQELLGKMPTRYPFTQETTLEGLQALRTQVFRDHEGGVLSREDAVRALNLLDARINQLEREQREHVAVTLATFATTAVPPGVAPRPARRNTTARPRRG